MDFHPEFSQDLRYQKYQQESLGTGLLLSVMSNQVTTAIPQFFTAQYTSRD